jgi:hypothetical protein
VDKKAVDDLKNILKDSKPAVEEQIRNIREQMKKDGRQPDAPAPSAQPEPVGGSFDDISTATPLPLQTGVNFKMAPIKADRVFRGSSRDPKNPARMLPDSDARTRTWVGMGHVTLREPTFAMDANEVDILFKEGEGPGGGSKDRREGPPGADPVKSSRSKETPFERIVARGSVRLMTVDASGRVQVARGGYMIYDGRTGSFVIRDWPEAEVGGKLLRSLTKNAVLRLSDLEATQPEFDAAGFDVFTVDQPLKPGDLPGSHEKPVPSAGPVLPKPSEAPSPSPR